MERPSLGIFSTHRKRTRAFSMIEVVIGTVVLMLIVLPTIATISQCLRVIDKARDTTYASSMMQSLVEQMRMQTYANVYTKYCTGGTKTSSSPDVYTYSSAKFAEDLKIERFLNANTKFFSISGTFTQQTTGQLYVQLTATWEDMNKVRQSHNMFTIISDGGLSDNVNKGW